MSALPLHRCAYCHRPITAPLPSGDGAHGEIVAIYVQHQGYGCDTGCCGHEVTAINAQGRRVHSYFTFDHAERGQDPQAFARDVASLHFPHVRIDWSRCEIINYAQCDQYGGDEDQAVTRPDDAVGE